MKGHKASAGLNKLLMPIHLHDSRLPFVCTERPSDADGAKFYIHLGVHPTPLPYGSKWTLEIVQFMSRTHIPNALRDLNDGFRTDIVITGQDKDSMHVPQQVPLSTTRHCNIRAGS